MNQILPATDKSNLVKLADDKIQARENFNRSYVLAAKWDELHCAYRPLLTTWDVFDQDTSLILLKADYVPQAALKTNQNTDDEPEESIVTGSIDPKTGRRRIVIDCDKKVVSGAIQPQVNWKLVPNYVYPKNLDKIEGWSNKKESELIAQLKSEGLLKPESEPMKPKTVDFKDGVKPEIKTYWIDILERYNQDLQLRYPDNEIERELSHALSQQLTFERLTVDDAISAQMATRPKDIKQSLIKDLYNTGALDAFPFKFRVTAYLLSKGFRDAESAVHIFRTECLGLKQYFYEIAILFFGVYSEHDFFVYQSMVESIVGKILKHSFAERADLQNIAFENLNRPLLADSNLLSNIWRRLNDIRSTLTPKQEEILQLLYLNDPQMTYQEASTAIGISVDSVRDRESGLVLKIRKAIPELKTLFPYKNWTKNQNRFYIFDGLVYLPSVRERRPCFRIKNINGLEVKECITGEDHRPNSDTSIKEVKYKLAAQSKGSPATSVLKDKSFGYESSI